MGKYFKWVLLLVFFIGLLLLTFWYVRQHMVATETFHARTAGELLPVKVAEIQYEALSFYIGAPGVGREYREVRVFPSLTTIINSVFVDVGDQVKEGSMLLEFDHEVIMAEVKEAEANLERAKVVLQNASHFYQDIKELFGKKYASLQQVNEAHEKFKIAQADYQTAHTGLILAKNRLNYAVVKSPCIGIIAERKVNSGELPQNNSPLFLINQIDPIFMEAEVAEEYINFVTLSQPVQVEFDALVGTVFQGEVSKIDQTVNPDTRTFSAFIKLANPSLKLKPGMSGFAKIGVSKRTLVVPNIAVVKPVKYRAAVFVVDQTGIVHKRDIKIGLITEKYTEVLGGLREGDLVVTAGLKGLRDQDHVTVKKEL